MSDAAVVANFEDGCPLEWGEVQIHKEVLSLLAKTLKSRKQKEPAMGTLVNSATVDPLHAMNNVREHLFGCFVTRCIQTSNFRRYEDIRVDTTSPLAKFFGLLKKKLHLHLNDHLREGGMRDGICSKLHIRLNRKEFGILL